MWFMRLYEGIYNTVKLFFVESFKVRLLYPLYLAFSNLFMQTHKKNETVFSFFMIYMAVSGKYSRIEWASRLKETITPLKTRLFVSIERFKTSSKVNGWVADVQS